MERPPEVIYSRECYYMTNLDSYETFSHDQQGIMLKSSLNNPNVLFVTLHCGQPTEMEHPPKVINQSQIFELLMA